MEPSWQFDIRRLEIEIEIKLEAQECQYKAALEAQQRKKHSLILNTEKNSEEKNSLHLHMKDKGEL